MSNHSESTLSAYKKDITIFTQWVKTVKKAKSLPDETGVLEFMEALKDGYPNNRPKRVLTLKRKLSAIGMLYEAKSKPFDKKVVLEGLKDVARFPIT